MKGFFIFLFYQKNILQKIKFSDISASIKVNYLDIDYENTLFDADF